jgi:hypothetical protein
VKALTTEEGADALKTVVAGTSGQNLAATDEEAV